MAKRRGRPSEEPTTQAGVPFDQMTPEQKAREFDASHARPTSYAQKHFGKAKPGEGGKGIFGFGKAKHKK
jgi:hypothetical protein